MSDGEVSRTSQPRTPRVVLAGNPNCGKTSLFNALTGGRHRVGNYAGVTVDRRSGTLHLETQEIEMVDLPGTYSLSSYTPEERVAQDELAAWPDLVVVVADSTQLSRGLVLLAQIMQTGLPIVLCLNMSDEAHAAGQVLDLVQMRKLLGFPVVETVGHKSEGLDALRGAIAETLADPAREPRLVLGRDLEEALATVRPHLPMALGPIFKTDWMATRLLALDQEYTEKLSTVEGGPALLLVAKQAREKLEADTGEDVAVFVTSRYFGFVDGLLHEVRTQRSREDARRVSDAVDSILVHPWLGLPIFACIMYAIFWITFSLGEAPMNWIESSVGWFGGKIGTLWPEGSDSLVRSLLVDGVLAGVGGVLTFLPNILLLFLGLAFLEDTGYMARAAFLTDRVMHRFGLHGKSFIPMMTGFGCSIPGIMATRTLENERDRLVTMLVLPLMSCGARASVWMLLLPAFFPPSMRAPMLWFVYAFGIALALVLALLLRVTVLKGDDAPFVMELPPYRLPTPKNLWIKMAEKGSSYVRKAGTTILAISIVLWAATAFPRLHTIPDAYRVQAVSASHGEQPPPDEVLLAKAQLEHSIAGHVGMALEPVFKPLGFDWKIVTGMLGAFAAKEVFVSQMSIVYAVGDGAQSTEGLRTLLARDYSRRTGLSLILFMLIATPCMATVAITRRESGKWSWALLQFGGLTGIAYLISLAVYQVGGVLGLG